MELDFKYFIKFIKERTGIEISVFSHDGKFIAGNGTTQTVTEKVDKILVEPDKNRTLFPIKHKHKIFIGLIDGATETQRNYAFLVGELAENVFFKEPDLSKTEFYKAILLGELNYSQLRKYTRKFSIPDVPSCVMIVSTDSDRIDEVINLLSTYGNENMDFAVKIDDNQCAFIKYNDETRGEYQSYTEYAEFLTQSVYEETGLTVKVSIGGTVKSVYDLSSSYAQALTAFRMSQAIKSKGEVHSYKEYILIKMLEDLPKYKLNEYLEILMDASARDVFNDEEMINTAEEFLENSLNISETSRNLYLHRNTLMYRLDKIEKLTGLNVRKFSDAVTFRLITILAKLVK